MPSITDRTIDEHYVATEEIPAATFIPRYMEKLADELFKDRKVGVRGFMCDKYDKFSPFLTLSDITVGPPLMFPDHPHCGHDMMLYVLEGEFGHEDFLGVRETFKEGDVHWMTTGKGIIHAQVPGKNPVNRHVQFWVNLPKNQKNCEPGNQVLRASKTPVIKEGAADIRLLVGEYAGEKSSIKTASPVLIMDVKTDANSTSGTNGKTVITLPGDFFVGVYVLKGNGKIGGQTLQPFSVATSKAGTSKATHLVCEGSMQFLLFAGTPIPDPIDFDGYFVCCNKEETQQAIKDFESRSNNFEKGATWSSKIAH